MTPHREPTAAGAATNLQTIEAAHTPRTISASGYIVTAAGSDGVVCRFWYEDKAMAERFAATFSDAIVEAAESQEPAEYKYDLGPIKVPVARFSEKTLREFGIG